MGLNGATSPSLRVSSGLGGWLIGGVSFWLLYVYMGGRRGFSIWDYKRNMIKYDQWYRL